jgi:branched-chain amino acid transport system permease protein
MLPPRLLKAAPYLGIVAGLILPWILTAAGANNLADQITKIFPLVLLGLALNVVVGYTGMLHLGGMAFIAIGVYVTAIAVHPTLYPFSWPSLIALVLSIVIGIAFGVVLGAPTLRLRGDYLALVTLGFGEMVKDLLTYLLNVTQGSSGITPIEFQQPPQLYFDMNQAAGWNIAMYYIALVQLIGVLWLLGNIENSRLGRAWIAIREDELAASCMGLNPARLKLAAFVLCAAIAGLAGWLFAYTMSSTTTPANTFDFNRSVMVLAALILGGLGNRYGVVLGVFLVFGFDQILIPLIDRELQANGVVFFQLSDFKFMLYGLALILMMRFRPEGILPEIRVAHEMHPERA